VSRRDVHSTLYILHEIRIVKVRFLTLLSMSILAFLVLGAIIGWIAGELVRGSGFGIASNVFAGIFGAVSGGFLFNLFGVETSGMVGNLIMAALGAFVLLFMLNLFGLGSRTNIYVHH
jgi:uncharacterized membrane protein YeaQ/YmgE (transglycosylase-associated protein family)